MICIWRMFYQPVRAFLFHVHEKLPIYECRFIQVEGFFQSNELSISKAAVIVLTNFAFLSQKAYPQHAARLIRLRCHLPFRKLKVRRLKAWLAVSTLCINREMRSGVRRFISGSAVRQCLAGDLAQFNWLRRSRLWFTLYREEELVSCRTGTDNKFNVAKLQMQLMCEFLVHLVGH